jgi:adenosyl cobinamide kinase/adenosyl cobinamide phosphate guanylyltransferase
MQTSLPLHKQKRIRTWSAKQIAETKFKELQLPDEFTQLIGTPSHNFCSIIFGKAKSGKSTFSLKLANALVPFGKVLYVSSEEMISKSLQSRIAHVNIDSDRIRFVGVRNVNDMERLVKSIHARFIIVDSAQVCNLSLRDFVRLKLTTFKNRKSWHIILQSTNNGMFKGGQEWVHETDVKIQVADGIARAEGRFNPDGSMIVIPHKSLQTKLL